MINNLKENQIFIFGSNLAGKHLGGAALQAMEWGAVEGQGEGLQGQTYAFPTLSENLKRRTESKLDESITKLYKCCVDMPDYEFLLTKVGCGIAGYSENFMKSLFIGAPKNITKPDDWK